MSQIFFENDQVMLYCGDMLDVLPRYPERFFHFLVADVPYGIGENNQKNLTRGQLADNNDWGDYSWDGEKLSRGHISEIIRVSENRAIFGANHYSSMIPDSSGWIVWDKDNGNTHFSDCELIYTSVNRAVRKFTYKWQGMLQGDMSNKEVRRYPTQKPIPVIQWILSNYIPAKHLMSFSYRPVICDPCMGSGTTIRAALDMGFKAVGIDKSEEACKITLDRILSGDRPRRATKRELRFQE